ncbi:hypothetical protein BFJ69_g936 [Fusarium oxysporum]|uniref:Uncharacterized protein n=1 Tax=Fusarium oxysporum TaxID=5507 RepID=A0A420P2F1_FUSOX|nr:hypothetical protein BFJ69_g936 [Fusarium oxysporum]
MRLKKRFSSIDTTWTKLLADDDYRCELISAYLWLIVHEHAFIGRNMVRGGGHIVNLKEMKEDLVENAPNIDNDDRPGPSLRHVARWCVQDTALFGHFFATRTPSDAKHTQATSSLWNCQAH